MSFKYFIATLFFLNVVATIAEAQQQIIPTPVTINAGKEYFSITPTTYILANDFSAFMDASAFREILYAHFNIPIKTALYRDNWDLSVARSISIVRILTDDYKIAPLRLTASGKGEFTPRTSNATAEGRALNRRTEIILSPKLDEIMQLLKANK